MARFLPDVPGPFGAGEGGTRLEEPSMLRQVKGKLIREGFNDKRLTSSDV